MDTNIKLVSPDGEELDIETLLSSIIKKIGEKDTMDKSQGRLIIGAYLEKLIEKEDPFVSALTTLGGEQILNAIGILLFVAFQLGYSVKAYNYTVKSL